MRIRSIKPEFWRSEDITALPVNVRLLFVGLWSYVDDNGVGIDDPRLITADLFPLEDDQTAVRDYVREGLATLSRGFQIVRYEVSGKRYLFITNWDKHQRIDKPAKPRYPRPETIPTRPNTKPEPEFATPSRDLRETLAPGTGEQRNRGTEEKTPSRSFDVTPPARANARDKATQLAATATRADTLTLVTNWNRNSGHDYTRSELRNLARALDELTADGANPDHYPTTLDIQHTEGHSLNFLPHAYREAQKQATSANVPARTGARGAPSRPSTTDQRVADAQALKHQMLAKYGNVDPRSGGLRLIEGAAS